MCALLGALINKKDARAFVCDDFNSILCYTRTYTSGTRHTKISEKRERKHIICTRSHDEIHTPQYKACIFTKFSVYTLIHWMNLYSPKRISAHVKRYVWHLLTLCIFYSLVLSVFFIRLFWFSLLMQSITHLCCDTRTHQQLS